MSELLLDNINCTYKHGPADEAACWLAYRQGRDHENCHDRLWRTRSTQPPCTEMGNNTPRGVDNTTKGVGRTGVSMAKYSVNSCE